MLSLAEKQQKIKNLRRKIAVCRRCPLHETRTHTVPGEGHANASILFIGEAPGRNEDEQGKPFIGRAGSVFDELLKSIKLTREKIYLCNILKCRPPDNRNPLSVEIEACVGNLDMQIQIVGPRIIGTLGNFATSYIFEKFGLPLQKISAVHGQTFDVKTEFGVKKIVPLFHPAVVTYNSTKLDVLIKDFKVFKAYI